MSAQNPVRAFFHEHFIAGMSFRNPPRRIPCRGHLPVDCELEVSLPRPAFTQTDSSQRGDREDDRRNAEVIGSLMVSLQEVCGHDLPSITRYGSQRQVSARGIPSRIHSWIRYTLHEFIDQNSPLVPFDPRRIQIQVIDLGHATSRMHNHLRPKRTRLPRGQCLDNQLGGALFDRYRFGSEMNVNAKFASSLNELINQIRVKKG